MDDEQRECVEAALLSSRRLTSLLSDILDISAVESGKLALFIRQFEPKELVVSVENLFAHLALEKGLSLQFSISPELPAVLVGDDQRLRQILFNLVGNAIKCTLSGGVTVEVYPLVSRHYDHSRTMFVVSDSGVGIPDDKIGDLFEPFVQGSVGYSREHQGAGLGLSICKRLTLLMGGNMCVTSEVN
ncbi:MAG: hypothetical protein KKB70_09870 [Proteobacteria bacterium]|nr:hypothetical protein [Pseudomonadota bacterium]MBU1611005.1 hypothetical protein [Pseudomonadota bacterium]